MTIEATDLGRSFDEVRISVRAERHPFVCDDCLCTWQVRYEVRDYLAPSGARWVVHCRDGQPVPAPSFGARCPRCGHVSVKRADDVLPPSRAASG